MVVVYNTMGHRKEELVPLKKGEIRMYVCGPTVYDYAHIGNARTAVSFDVIRRYLEYRGYKVKYVSNITDVGHLTETEVGEDKIVKKAKLEKVTPFDIARLYTEEYFKDMDALNVKRPDITPKATDHIKDIIEWVQKIMDKGFAYEVNGNVYFDVSAYNDKFGDYGKLANIKLDDLKVGVRIDVSEDKSDPRDFALWKKADPEHAMKWESPWGLGYPGWHIECTVMSIKYLGEQFDIHGGGKDLIFPHHTNEIAQAKAVTGKDPVKYWLHTEYVKLNGEKMSKSTGNFKTAREVIEKYGGDVVRFFITKSHYRREMNFSDEDLESAKEGLRRLKEALDRIKDAINKSEEGEVNKDLVDHFENLKSKFIEEMDDDFNTPGAVAVLFNIATDINKNLDQNKTTLEKIKSIYEELLNALGIFFIEEKPPEEVLKLVEEREKARKEKNWELADSLREKIKSFGWYVEDTRDGPKLKKL